MRTLPILAALFAALLGATPALADYTCRFTDRCLAGGICQDGKSLSFDMTWKEESWHLVAPEGEVEMMLNPLAGTYFGHAFIGAQGVENRMDAYQLTIGRNGSAFYSLHVVGDAPTGIIWRGRCEVVG